MSLTTPIRFTLRAFLVIAVVADFAPCVGAKPKPFAVQGKITAVDSGKRQVTILDAKRKKPFTVYVGPKREIHRYSKGSKADLKAGADVKVYGKVDTDAKRVGAVTNVTIMPVKSRYLRKHRVDGTLVKQGDGWAVKNRGDVYSLDLKPDVGVEYVTVAGFEDLAVGKEATVVVENEKGGVYTPRNELRIHEPRPEAGAARAASKPSPYAHLQRSGKSGFPLVDGPVQAVIVYARGATVTPMSPKKRYARIETGDMHRELGKWVEKVTGRELRQVSEDAFRAGAGVFPIYVGDCDASRNVLKSDLAKIDREGFVICIEDNAAYIRGPYITGTWFGVCDFIERYLGVRWLMPGELGEDYRSMETVVLKPGKVVDEPKIPARQWSGWYQLGPEGRLWQYRQRVMMNSWGHRYRFSHSHYKIFPVDKYYDEHPDFYSMRDGKRSRPERAKAGWQICMTNPATVSVAAEYARKYFDENLEKDACGFGVNDSGGYCECPKCRAMMPTVFDSDYMSPRDYMYSKMFFSWLGQVGDELAKTHPGKLLGCLAYGGNTPSPPKDVPIARNILPYMCVTISDMYRPWYRKACERLIDSWGERVDQIALYDYAHSQGNVFPRMYMHVNQDILQYAMKRGLKSVYAEAAPIFGLDAPRFYITARLWWNPDLDIDAELADWCGRMFGDAADPMRRYFERCESAWMNYDGFWARMNTPYAYHRFWRTPILEVYTPEVMAECTALLDEAAKAAKTDRARQRVAYFRHYWDAGVAYAESYWPAPALREAVAKNASLGDAAKALRETPEAPSEKDLLKQFHAAAQDPDLDYYVRKPKSWWLPTPGVRLGWRTCLTPDATLGLYKTLPWFAERLAGPVVREASADASPDVLRKSIEGRMADLFPSGGSQTYRESVEALRRMSGKIVAAHRAEAPPKIDGKLDDAVWTSAQPLDGFTCIGSDLVDSAYAVSGRVAWDDANLYVAFDCPRQKMNEEVPDIRGDVEMPAKWTAFGPYGPFAQDANKHPMPAAEALKAIPERLTVGDVTREAATVTPENCVADLEQVNPGKPIGLTYYVYMPFESAKAQKVTFGFGADWWMQVWVDGKAVFDNTMSMEGNKKWPPAVSNHLRTVSVRKGAHLMVVRFLRGSGSARLAVGAPSALRKVPRAEWAPDPAPLAAMPQPGKRDGVVQVGDYVGLSVRSVGKRSRGSLILVNPDGTVRDERDGDLHFDFDLRSAVDQRPDAWTVELAVPLEGLGVDPRGDRAVRVNLLHCLTRWHLATWYPEPARGRHDAEANTGWVLLRD